MMYHMITNPDLYSKFHKKLLLDDNNLDIDTNFIKISKIK